MVVRAIGNASRRGLWILAAWSGIGLFDASQNIFTMRSQGMHHAWPALFLTLLLSWLPWALATPLVIVLGRRFSPLNFRSAIVWTVHLGAAVAVSLLAAAWLASLEILLNPWAGAQPPGPFATLWLLKFYTGLLSSLILYACLLAGSFGLFLRDRIATQQTEAARLSEQLSTAKLNALRRQIEPHFLFNTLNGIAGLVREGRNQAAVSMIVALSEFLRRVVQDPDQSCLPLEQELEYLRHYLQIQQLRFGARLQVSMDVPGELCSAQVPSLLLQPLAENAIKHGISKRLQGGAIRFAACSAGGRLNLSIYNDGPTLAQARERSGRGVDGGQQGTGMVNLRTRLQILYGNEFELTLRDHETSGVLAFVSVPHRHG